MQQTSAPLRPRAASLDSPVNRRVLHALTGLPPAPTPLEPYVRSRGLTAGELARRLSLHVSTVRDHLGALEADGLVRHRDERGRVGRPRRHYAADPDGVAGLTAPDPYELFAVPLREVLAQGDADPEAAGRRWAAAHVDEFVPPGLPVAPAVSRAAFLAKVGALADTLERWGYRPEVATSNAGHTAEIRIARCPLLELATESAAAVCGVHAGMLGQALADLGEPDADLRLVPFARPGVCVARITTRATFPSPGEPRPSPDRKASHD